MSPKKRGIAADEEAGQAGEPISAETAAPENPALTDKEKAPDAEAMDIDRGDAQPAPVTGDHQPGEVPASGPNDDTADAATAEATDVAAAMAALQSMATGGGPAAEHHGKPACCCECASTSSSCGWYWHKERSGLRVCHKCYKHRLKYGSYRPVAPVQKRPNIPEPNGGTCCECGISESVAWTKHKTKVGAMVCNACNTRNRRYGSYSPRKPQVTPLPTDGEPQERACSDCSRTWSSRDRWFRARDASGEVRQGLFLCKRCYTRGRKKTKAAEARAGVAGKRKGSGKGDSDGSGDSDATDDEGEKTDSDGEVEDEKADGEGGEKKEGEEGAAAAKEGKEAEGGEGAAAEGAPSTGKKRAGSAKGGSKKRAAESETPGGEGEQGKPKEKEKDKGKEKPKDKEKDKGKEKEKKSATKEKKTPARDKKAPAQEAKAAVPVLPVVLQPQGHGLVAELVEAIGMDAVLAAQKVTLGAAPGQGAAEAAQAAAPPGVPPRKRRRASAKEDKTEKGKGKAQQPAAAGDAAAAAALAAAVMAAAGQAEAAAGGALGSAMGQAVGVPLPMSLAAPMEGLPPDLAAMAEELRMAALQGRLPPGLQLGDWAQPLLQQQPPPPLYQPPPQPQEQAQGQGQPGGSAGGLGAPGGVVIKTGDVAEVPTGPVGPVGLAGLQPQPAAFGGGQERAGGFVDALQSACEVGYGLEFPNTSWAVPMVGLNVL